MNVRGMREKNARNVPAFSAHTKKKTFKRRKFRRSSFAEEKRLEMCTRRDGIYGKKERESVAYIK